MDAGQPAPQPTGGNTTLSFLSQYSIAKQLQILGGVLVVLVLLIAGIVYNDQRESTYNTSYVAATGELRMLSQRLAKASSLAIQGEAAAFKQLRESHTVFATNLDKLAKGGVLGENLVPPLARQRPAAASGPGPDLGKNRQKHPATAGNGKNADRPG